MAERGGRLVRAENKRWKMHGGSEDDNADTNAISLFMSRLLFRLDAGASTSLQADMSSTLRALCLLVHIAARLVTSHKMTGCN